MEAYKLIKIETGKKTQKYIYNIVDASGKIIVSRGSNRDYVAATSDGGYFFGRIDLIGKGDHGRNMNYIKETISNGFSKYEKNKKLTEQEIEKYKNDLIKHYTTIAYL